MTRSPGTRLRFIRPFTTNVFNRLSVHFAGWAPGFAILTHVGRTSGKTYRTPINVFRRGEHYVFALTYGSDVQWLKNIFAAGACSMRTRGRDVHLVEPELIVDPKLRLMPWPVRVMGRFMRVTELLRMRADADGETPDLRAAAPDRPTGMLRFLLGLPAHLYHLRLGFLLGHRFLLLVHTGRRTGRHRETVLEVVRYDPVTDESVVLAGWGRRAGWLHNVKAGLGREVRTGAQRYVPAWRILPVEEAETLFADYERRNRVAGPIVRAVLGRLLGWRYDGTPAARRRAVEQLAFVGFRPTPPPRSIAAPSDPAVATGAPIERAE